MRKLDQLPVGINERLIALQLNLKNKWKAIVILAYAPTLIADQQAKKEFYSDLDTALSAIPMTYKIMFLGDFNAHEGKDQHVWKKIIGKEGTGKVKSNREMLLTKCAEHGLTITNTLFRQKDSYKNFMEASQIGPLAPY